MNQSMQASLLVVDDNKVNRDLLARRLKHAGYHVELAVDGYQALALNQDRHFDLILLDVTMPGLSGFEVLEVIRQKYTLSELPVIIVTALDASDDMVTGFKVGANDYVTKPIDYSVLQARIHTHLELRKLAELKDQFLQIASHDLKNPLNNVLMSICLMLADLPPGQKMSDQYYEILGLMKTQCETMQRIITDFLDFEALQDGKFQLQLNKIDVNDTVQRVVHANLEYAQSKNIALEMSLEPAAPVQADEGRIAQVLQNFVGNALKFCPPDAGVIVRTHTEDHHLRVEVCDSGPGLTEADLAKAFTKYARLSNKPTGGEKSSGLGLAISKQMIELHGGAIGVYNNPDCGATFWFSLPLS